MSDAIGKLYILLGLKSTIDEDSKKATAAANKTAVAVGAALTGVGIAAKMMSDDVNRSFLSFDSAMTEVKALGGVTEEEFESMRVAALDLSTQFPIAATDVADAMYLMISVGYEYQDMMATIPEAAALATAGNMSMAEATNSLINVMGIYGDRAGSSVEISKVFANAVGVGKYEMGDLMTQMMKTIGVAGQLNVRFSDLAAYNVALQNSFSTAEEAGTSFNAALIKLTDPATVQKLDAMGVSVSNADGSFRDLTDIFADLDTALAGVQGDAERMAIVTDMFGTYGQRAALALMQQTDALPALKHEISGLNLIEDQLNTKLEGTAQRLEMAENKMDKARVTLGGAMAPATIAAAEAMGGLALVLETVPAPLQAIAGTGLTAAQSLIVIGPALAGIVPAINAYRASTFAATVATQGFTVALLANPAALAAVAIGALVLTLGTYYLSSKKAESATKDLNQAEQSAIDIKRERIKEAQRQIEADRARLQYLRDLQEETTRGGGALNRFAANLKETEIDEYAESIKDLTAEIADLDEQIADLEDAEIDLELAQSQHNVDTLESGLSKILGLMDEIQGKDRDRAELEDSEAVQEIRVRTSQKDLDEAEDALAAWRAGGDNAYALEFGAEAGREHEQELIDDVTEAQVALNRATREHGDTLAEISGLDDEYAEKQSDLLTLIADLNGKYPDLALNLQDVADGQAAVNEKVREYIALTPAGQEALRQVDLLLGIGQEEEEGAGEAASHTPTSFYGRGYTNPGGWAAGSSPEDEEELKRLREIRNQLDTDNKLTNEDLQEIYRELKETDLPNLGTQHDVTVSGMIAAIDTYIKRQETAIANMQTLGGGPGPALPAPSDQPQASAAVGLPYVPRDMNVRVHRGEAIVPADQAARTVTININHPTVRDDSDIDRLTNQLFRRLQRA